MSLLLSRNEVENIDKEKLKQFISLGAREGAQLDYKQKLSSGSKHESYKEFLKDVTAFANAHGGLLILGVKEPDDIETDEEQILGMPNGAGLATDLERLSATSIDPRIPGLLIKPIKISADTDVIIVYIPTSMTRPHMVSYRGHRSFYIRHSESSVPMTTHEIRDSVLTSATSEARARILADEEKYETIEYIIKEKPGFLLQAIPLVTITEPWDVLGGDIDNIIRGGHRRDKYIYLFDLASDIRPIPTIKGVIGRESRQSNNWQTDVHRNGYIQAVYMDIQSSPDNTNIFTLHDNYSNLFRSFCEFCEEIWHVTQSDIPYLFKCHYVNAQSTAFWTKDYFNKITSVYGRDQILWSDQIRLVGQSTQEISDNWTIQLFNAFGLNWKLPD